MADDRDEAGERMLKVLRETARREAQRKYDARHPNRPSLELLLPKESRQAKKLMQAYVSRIKNTECIEPVLEDYLKVLKRRKARLETAERWMRSKKQAYVDKLRMRTRYVLDRDGQGEPAESVCTEDTGRMASEPSPPVDACTEVSAPCGDLRFRLKAMPTITFVPKSSKNDTSHLKLFFCESVGVPFNEGCGDGCAVFRDESFGRAAVSQRAPSETEMPPVPMLTLPCVDTPKTAQPTTKRRRVDCGMNADAENPVSPCSFVSQGMVAAVDTRELERVCAVVDELSGEEELVASGVHDVVPKLADAFCAGAFDDSKMAYDDEEWSDLLSAVAESTLVDPLETAMDLPSQLLLGHGKLSALAEEECAPVETVAAVGESPEYKPCSADVLFTPWVA